MQVSKRLNLAPIAKDLTKAARVKAYRERVQHLEKLIKRGGMSPMLTQRAEEYLRSAQFRIRQLTAPKPVKRKFTNRQDLTHTVDPRLLRAVAAVDHELATKGTVGGVPLKKTAKAPKAKPVNSAQGILPNFLSQLNNARIEELVAEKIYQALARGLDLQLNGRGVDEDSEVG